MESLQRWSLIAEIVGGFAVVLSIVYLAVEVNNNTGAIYSQTNQGLMEMWLDVSSPIVEDKEVTDIFLRAKKDLANLDENELYRYWLITDGAMAIWEQAFYSNHNGTLDEDLWLVWDKSFTNWFCLEANPAIWELIRDNYVGEFKLHGDAVVLASCSR